MSLAHKRQVYDVCNVSLTHDRLTAEWLRAEPFVSLFDWLVAFSKMISRSPSRDTGTRFVEFVYPAEQSSD